VTKLALVLAAAGLLRLFPPGWHETPRDTEAVRAHMPAALANGSRTTNAPMRMRVTVSPSPSRLGQRLRYRATMDVDFGTRVRFSPPGAGGAFTWGAAHTGEGAFRPAGFPFDVNSVWIEAPLQVFATGPVSLPGGTVELRYPNGDRWVVRLPTAHVLVLPMLTPADTAATLRPVRGPTGAPWWERAPWSLVAAAAGLLALLVVLVRRLTRRRSAPQVAPAPVARAARDPVAEALAELERLRGQHLPEQGRYGEHALALTRILRRYLEVTMGTPRPGDTSPELVGRLRGAKLPSEDVTRLDGLLALWDRIKFGRATLAMDEAVRGELAVEGLVRRRERPREVA